MGKLSMRGKHFPQDGNNSLQATLKLLLKYASFKLSSWAGSVEVWAQWHSGDIMKLVTKTDLK